MIQGRLTDSAGAALPSGAWSFTLKIFDAEIGGNELWPGGPGETQSVDVDASGLWNAALIRTMPITYSTTWCIQNGRQLSVQCSRFYQ